MAESRDPAEKKPKTHFPGMAERLQKELSAIAPGSARIEVAAPSEHGYGARAGGSALSCQDSFHDTWITPEHYAEQGPAVIDGT
ncbi:hypothetical protein [Streptomyces sp. NPDC054838]